MKCHEQVLQSHFMMFQNKPIRHPFPEGLTLATLQVCLGSELILRAMSDASNGDWLEFIHLPSRSTGPAFSDVSCLDVYPKWRCPVFFAWVWYRFLLSSAGTFCEFSNAKWFTRMSQKFSKCFVTCLQDDIGEEFANIPCSCLYIYICYKCMLGMVYPGHTVTRCQ